MGPKLEEVLRNGALSRGGKQGDIFRWGQKISRARGVYANGPATGTIDWNKLSVSQIGKKNEKKA